MNNAHHQKSRREFLIRNGMGFGTRRTRWLNQCSSGSRISPPERSM